MRLARAWGAGDIDQDGVPDFLLFAPRAYYTPKSFFGSVTLYSGATGQQLHRTRTGKLRKNFIKTVGDFATGIGDFDGDGIDDYASGGIYSFYKPRRGTVSVWSGATSSLIVTVRAPLWKLPDEEGFGLQIGPLGDLDGDGRTEFAASLTDNFPTYCDVIIYGGPDGHIVRYHRGWDYQTGKGLGRGAPDYASVGDTTGDGVPEYVISWDFGDGPTPLAGVVVLFDGATGDEIRRHYGRLVWGWSPPPRHIGKRVIGTGDIDLDGVPDYAAAGGLRDSTCVPVAGSGAIKVFSGRTGKALRQISVDWFPGEFYGCAFKDRTHSRLDGGEDVNGDGIPDLLCRQNDRLALTGATERGTVRVYSGQTGTMLWMPRTRTYGADYGALLGDLDGDGCSEFSVGFEQASAAPWNGEVTVYRGGPGDAQRVCTAGVNSAGTAATIEFLGPISISNNFLHLVIRGGVPHQPGRFFYGPEYTWQPVGAGVLCVGAGSVGRHAIGDQVVLDDNGGVVLDVDIRAGPMRSGAAAWVPGSTWTVQFAYSDPGGLMGFNLSDAMRVTWTR